MVSNKLTNRRLTARKPPVCHSGPAVGSILFPPQALQLKRTPLEKKLPGITSPIVPRTGRCPPPPPETEITCSLAKDEPLPIYTGEEFTLLWAACNPALPPTPQITPEVTAILGTIGNVESGENCTSDNDIIYHAPDDPGTDTITMTVTFSDSTTCLSILTLDITEEEEDD